VLIDDDLQLFECRDGVVKQLDLCLTHTVKYTPLHPGLSRREG